MELQFFNSTAGILAQVGNRMEYLILFRDYIALETTGYHYELCRVREYSEDEVIISRYGREFFRTPEDAMNRVRDIVNSL